MRPCERGLHGTRQALSEELPVSEERKNRDEENRQQQPHPEEPQQQPQEPVARSQQEQSAQQTVPGPATDRLSRRLLLVLLAISIAVSVPILLVPFIVPLVLALTFTTILYPVYKRLLRLFRYHRKTTSAICILLFLLLLLIPSFILIDLVVGEAVDLYVTIEPVVRDLIDKGSESEIVQYLQRSVIFRLFRLSEVNWGQVLEQVARSASGIVTTIINRTSAGVFGLILNLFIMLFTMFYFFVDGPNILDRLRNLLPMRREYEDMIIDRFTLISRATVNATLFIGLAQGAVGGLTLFIFGIDTWLLWGFIMVILSVIPLVGPWIVLIPAAIIQIILGNVWAGVGIVLSSTLIVSSLDNLIRPRVVGAGARIHDLLIFFATLGGLSYFGVMGFIIGPALAAFVISILDIYSKEYRSQIEAANTK